MCYLPNLLDLTHVMAVPAYSGSVSSTNLSLLFSMCYETAACLRILEEMEGAGVCPDYTSVRITLNALAAGYRMQEVRG
jgi:hypothetical protein